MDLAPDQVNELWPVGQWSRVGLKQSSDLTDKIRKRTIPSVTPLFLDITLLIISGTPNLSSSWPPTRWLTTKRFSTSKINSRYEESLADPFGNKETPIKNPSYSSMNPFNI